MKKRNLLFILTGIVFIYSGIAMTVYASEDTYYKNNPGCVIDRGNPERTGVYNERISDHPKILWQTGATSLHAPICADNLIVMNPLVAFNPANGKKVWDVGNIGGKYHYPATYYNGVLYWDKIDGRGYGQEEKSLNLMKYNAKTGKLLYQKGFGVGNSNGLLIYNDIAYLCLYDGVTAYDLKKNKILWKSGGLVQGGISTDGHALFVSNGGLYVLDMQNGRLLWKNDAISGQATLGKEAIYADFLSDDDKVGIIAYEKKTGKVIWKRYLNDVPGFSKHGGLSDITLHQDRLFVSNRVREAIITTNPTRYSPVGGGVYALDAKTGKLLWHKEVSPFTDPISINNTLYVGGQNIVYALNEKTGEERWHLSVEDDVTRLVPYQNKLFLKLGMYSRGKLLAIG